MYTLTNGVGMHVLVLQKSIGMFKKITQGQFGDYRVAINTDGSLSFLLMSLAAPGIHIDVVFTLVSSPLIIGR